MVSNIYISCSHNDTCIFLFYHRFQKRLYSFSMYCFSSLVNCTTLKELVRSLLLLKVLYCSDKKTLDCKKAYNAILDIINSLNKEITLPDEECCIEETFNDVKEFDNGCAYVKPFGAYFQHEIA